MLPAVESILDTPKVNYAFRQRAANSIRRAKLISLETQPTEAAVVLVVTLTQQNTANFDIGLQVIPVEGGTYLPAGLKLAVLDEAGEKFLEISAGDSDNLIQTRQFGGRSQERFSIQISLGEESVTESFVI
jgi:hypothetical protein